MNRDHYCIDDKLNPNEAAEFLGYKSKQTLANMRMEGKGPAYQKLSPKKIFYRVLDLLIWEELRSIIPWESHTQRAARCRLAMAGITVPEPAEKQIQYLEAARKNVLKRLEKSRLGIKII